MLKPGMPCLVKGAATLLTYKPGLDGGGFAEASMMLKLNKHLMPYNPEKLILLDNSDWKNHIPKHPIFDEELQIEDDDGSLVENGEQHELDIDDHE